MWEIDTDLSGALYHGQGEVEGSSTDVPESRG